MRQLAVALFAVLQAGCTIGTSTSLSLDPPNDAQAIVVVMRNAGGCGYNFRIFAIPCAYELWLDGRKVAQIADKEHVRFSYSKGEHEFTINWPPNTTYRSAPDGRGEWMFGHMTRVVTRGKIELRGGETHYFLFSPGYLRELSATEAEFVLKQFASE